MHTYVAAHLTDYTRFTFDVPDEVLGDGLIPVYHRLFPDSFGRVEYSVKAVMIGDEL